MGKEVPDLAALNAHLEPEEEEIRRKNLIATEARTLFAAAKGRLTQTPIENGKRAIYLIKLIIKNSGLKGIKVEAIENTDGAEVDCDIRFPVITIGKRGAEYNVWLKESDDDHKGWIILYSKVPSRGNFRE